MTLEILKNDIAIGDKNVHLIVENLIFFIFIDITIISTEIGKNN